EAPSFPGPAETQLAAGGGTADPAGMGDFLGYSYNRIITVPFPQTFVTATRTVFVASPVGFNPSTGQNLFTPAYPATQGSRTTQVGSSLERVVRVFIESQGAFKFADNESPQPQDRVYVNYNFFDNINPAINNVPALGTAQVPAAVTFNNTQLLQGLPRGTIIL